MPHSRKSTRKQPPRKAKRLASLKVGRKAPTRGGLRSSTMRQRAIHISPPTHMGRYEIFTGARNFTSAFSKAFWSKPGNQTCTKCGIALKPGQRGIDHIKPWSVLQTTLREYIVCKDGFHWKVTLKKDFLALYQDERNLQPMCKKCNSSKGGVKGLDPAHPQLHRGEPCPEDNGKRCRRRKAT